MLAICIPTFNRAIFLEEVIGNLVSPCTQNNIQIFVSDNASSDNTQEMMEELTKKYTFVHYHRHHVNIGPDDNFEYVLKMPDTKYRWLLSDTCYVDNLDEVIRDLERNDFDAYVLNGAPDRAKYLPKEKKQYNDSIDVLKEIGWHLTWISCMIYNKNMVEKMNFDHYKKSSFNQTALIFEPTSYRSSLICFNPNVEVKALPIRKESAWHYHVFDIFYRDWYLFVMSLPVYYPYEAKMACIKANAKNAIVLCKMMHAKRRSMGMWSLADVSRNKFFIQQCDGHYWLLFVLGLCPSKLLDICFSIGHTLKNRN